MGERNGGKEMARKKTLPLMVKFTTKYTYHVSNIVEEGRRQNRSTEGDALSKCVIKVCTDGPNTENHPTRGSRVFWGGGGGCLIELGPTVAWSDQPWNQPLIGPGQAHYFIPKLKKTPKDCTFCN